MFSRGCILGAALLLIASGCGGSPPKSGEGVPVHFDPCVALTVVPDQELSSSQAAGIRAGMALWNGLAHTQLSLGTVDALPPLGALDAPPPVLSIHFQTAAAPFHGFYDDQTGRVFINEDLVDASQAIVIAHELGHAFALNHVNQRKSVMNTGNLETTPTSQDVDALAERWGRCPSGNSAAAP